jgi:hypothetical protein
MARQYDLRGAIPYPTTGAGAAHPKTGSGAVPHPSTGTGAIPYPTTGPGAAHPKTGTGAPFSCALLAKHI